MIEWWLKVPETYYILLALRTLFHILTSPKLGHVPQSMEYHNGAQPNGCWDIVVIAHKAMNLVVIPGAFKE